MQTHPKANLSQEQIEQLKKQLAISRQELVISVEALAKVVESRNDCDVLNSGDAASFNEAHERAVTLINRQKETMRPSIAFRRVDTVLARRPVSRFLLSG